MDMVRLIQGDNSAATLFFGFEGEAEYMDVDEGLDQIQRLLEAAE